MTNASKFLKKPARARLLALGCSIYFFCAVWSAVAEEAMLKQCPDSPNCMSSQETRDAKRVDAMRPTAAPAEALKKIAGYLSKAKGYAIVEQRDDYVHATFTSSLMKYVDDVEFLIVNNLASGSADDLIHVRSASRKGYWDFGANRKRVESLRSALIAEGVLR